MIRRSLLILAASLSLAACTGAGPVASAGSTPADTSASAPTTPLASTTIDDQAIIFAYQTLDVAASAADVLLATGVVKPGSPEALRLAGGLEGAKTWLGIASDAQKAGQADNYFAALAQGTAALHAAQVELAKMRY